MRGEVELVMCYMQRADHTHLNDAVVLAVLVEGVLDVALANNAKMPDHLQNKAFEYQMHFVPMLHESAAMNASTRSSYQSSLLLVQAGRITWRIIFKHRRMVWA